MQRRKYLAALGSLAAGGAAITGTGAFNALQANRSVTVDVVTDENAYLSLKDTSPYAKQTSDGTLSFDFSGQYGAQNGDGINPKATTEFANVFEIQNQGTNDIKVGLQFDLEDTSGQLSKSEINNPTGFVSANLPNGQGSIALPSTIRYTPGASSGVNINFYNFGNNGNNQPLEGVRLRGDVKIYAAAVQGPDDLVNGFPSNFQNSSPGNTIS